ncbi:MAG: helix-hairpin-helix domain-containing protein [Bacteroidota bacterium]
MKGIKRASHFLKQYFVFSRTERKGIYALLLLIALSLAIPRLWVIAFPPGPLQFSSIALPEEDKSDFHDRPITDETNPASSRLFAFDPNTADSATLTSLGFPARTARSIINYRNKGGRFRKAEDLYRIYNADSALISRIIPYAQIEAQEHISQQYDNKQYPVSEHKAFAPVEVNTADSVALVKLYGIGPKMAAKIIDHRIRSGGFFTVDQLTEIYGIDEGLLDELKGKIYADASLVRYININTVTFEGLKQHPYLRYKTANAIINYRNQHGPFKAVEDLKKIVILPDSTYQKLLPYIRLEGDQ